MHYAAEHSYSAIADLLIQHGANLEVRATSNKLTPLHHAARHGHPDIIRLLIASGADINAKDEDGRTPLHGAAFYGFTQAIDVLVASKANLDIRDVYGMTPMHLAVFCSSSGINNTSMFAKLGANTNIPDTWGITPEEWAIFLKCSVLNERAGILPNIETRRKEIGLKVSKAKNSSGFTPMHFAAKIGNSTLVQKLIDNGIAHKVKDNVVNAKTFWGASPSYYAIKNGNRDVINLLRNHDATIQFKDIWATQGWRNKASVLKTKFSEMGWVKFFRRLLP